MNRQHEYANVPQAAQACAEFMVRQLHEAVQERERASLAVSGGRSPALLFDAMRALDFPWTHLDVFFVDERSVPPDSPDSNYRLANEHLFLPLDFPEENVYRIDGELEPHKAAELYTAAIQGAFEIDPGDLPVFDVIHQGMGPDGHTASLFPGEPLIADRKGIAAAVEASTKPPKDRITLLPGVLLKSRSTVFFVDGDEKRAALQEVLTGAYDPMKYPSQLLSRSAKDVDWFVAGILNITWP
jgi:6-phosphogluconolactonase